MRVTPKIVVGRRETQLVSEFDHGNEPKGR
jgi:hypothetical protein